MPGAEGTSRTRRLLRAAHRVALRILTERASPVRLGLAVAVGVIIGTSPFMGFHLFICILVATLLGLNRAVTYLAANISVPWVAPFLIFGSVQLGSWALTGSWLPLALDTIAELDPYRFAGAWLLGSLMLGSIIGIPAGAITWAAVAAYRRRHPLPPDQIGDAMAQVAEQYRSQGRFTFGYVSGKLNHDPVYRQLAERSPLPSPVVDVGCGRGQTLLLLSQLQPGLEGLGLDWDEPKLSMARAAARGLSCLRFQRGDLRHDDLPPAGTLLLIDVLHYNPPEIQRQILERTARMLKPGGRLYVREVDAEAGWRARVNIWQEKLGCALGFNRGATLEFRPAQEYLDILRAAGLETELAPSWGDTPFANVLIEGRRAS